MAKIDEIEKRLIRIERALGRLLPEGGGSQIDVSQAAEQQFNPQLPLHPSQPSQQIPVAAPVETEAVFGKVVTQGRDPVTYDKPAAQEVQHVPDEELAGMPPTIDEQQRMAMRRGEMQEQDERTPNEKYEEALKFIRERQQPQKERMTPGMVPEPEQMPNTATPHTGIDHKKQPHDQGEQDAADAAEATARFAEMIADVTTGIAARLLNATRDLEEVRSLLEPQCNE